MQILLVQPPIHDFTAYDFWLRPYGMLRVAGRIRHSADLTLFDFLASKPRDAWGRGRFQAEIIPKPEEFRDIPRHFRRFGRPRAEFQDLLKARSFNAVLIQTMMTYWYPGVREVIEDTRRLQPDAKIILGGVYSTLCPKHASTLGADLVVEGNHLEGVWRLLGIEPRNEYPAWVPPVGEVGILKLTEGCPFRCTYCSVPISSPGFEARAVEDCLEELRRLLHLGVKQIAFYDDALLYRAHDVLIPFLEGVRREGLAVSFHTPNALNARYISAELASLMVQSGFRSFFLGFESGAENWQRSTGGKVSSTEFADAARNLRIAGAEFITTYILAGHPDTDGQEIEPSMNMAHEIGARILLSEFSPVPGTADAAKCSAWADLSEPLSHNKTAFAFRRLGGERLARLKDLARELNHRRI